MRGPIAWMVGNPVAANLLMIVCLVGGALVYTRVTQEVFPDLSEEIVSVQVRYPGATPQEVEQGICLAVEEAVRGIDGVDEIVSTASEGMATVTARLIDGADAIKVYQDIQSEIDRIRTFPEEAERPQVSLAARRRSVINLVLYGDAPEASLRRLAEAIRDRLLLSPEITQIDLGGVRDYEISIEVSQDNLRRYGFTHRDLAARIGRQAVELSGGGVKTDGGEVLLRMAERRNFGQEFARIPIAFSEDGTPLELGQVADVIDGFEDSDRFAFYNNQPAVMLEVFRVGRQTPAGIADAVYSMLPQIREQLPDGVGIEVLSDRTRVFFDRAGLLLRNGAIGLLLVLLLLGLFLEIRLAFWVMMGIPISFLGSMLLMPALGLSINMITLFAYILSLGIVVDDAIVVGENVYHYRQVGMDPREAAVRGTREVASPVGFSILTNIVAFLPLIVLPGMMGRVMGMLPLVVISVFIFSWVESLYVLPAHLSHLRRHPPRGLGRWLHVRQQRFSEAFARWVRNRYGPFLDLCLRHRYVVVTVSLTLLLLVGGYWRSGRLGFSLFAAVESDWAQATVTMPFGVNAARTRAVADHLVRAAQEVVAETGRPELAEGIFSEIGSGGSHRASIRVYLAPPDVRNSILGTAEFVSRWRQKAGAIPGVRSIRYAYDSGGPGAGSALTIELRHEEVCTLEEAAMDLAASLASFPLVQDIDDGVQQGKPQIDFRLRPEAVGLGLTAEEIGRQVRGAFEGAEVLRQQRGRNELKVRVRLPREERIRLFSLEQFLLRTPDGGEIPLGEAVEMEAGHSYTAISRRNGLRAQTVTADVRPRSKAGEVMLELDASVLPALMEAYPGLDYSYEGIQAENRDSVGSMRVTLPLVLVAIYALLAIPFRSYSQPLIVMACIPFGVIGAVLGHILMGYSMTMIGVIGMLALSGVVVNDALVLISFANDSRRRHATAHDAVVSAGMQRFRPILLTTLTTFGGLAPMIFETSRQARFLIPMAISLGYGLLFATAITLVLVPSLYMIVEDVKERVGRLLPKRGEAGK